MPNEISYTTEEINAVWQQRYATLREARQRFADSDLQKQDTNHQYVIFQSGEKRFAFPLAQVAEVLPLGVTQKGTLIPGASASFWGLLLVRGEVRPVFDIKQLLGVAATATDDSEHILFVHDHEQNSPVGFLTDRVEKIERLPERTGNEEVPNLPGRFVSRLYQQTAEMPPIQVVDVAALLASLRGDAAAQQSSMSFKDENPSVLTDDFASASVEEE